jgi:hypothetical protein
LGDGSAKDEHDSDDVDAASHSKSDVDMDVEQLDDETMLDIRDVNHKADKMFAAPERQLLCRNIAMVFDPTTVYGSRQAFHTGLLVMSKEDPNNIFLTSKLWRHGCITDIRMLPRSDMFKEPCAGVQHSSMLQYRQSCKSRSPYCEHRHCPRLAFVGILVEGLTSRTCRK